MNNNRPLLWALLLCMNVVCLPLTAQASTASAPTVNAWVSGSKSKPQTASIGDFGNAVIAGHRNYSYGSHFNRLGEMAVGDVIRFTSTQDETMEFIVVEILETLPSDSIAFEQDANVQMLTLYTCTPGSHGHTPIAHSRHPCQVIGRESRTKQPTQGGFYIDQKNAVRSDAILYASFLRHTRDGQ